jgi:hypothetical protein
VSVVVSQAGHFMTASLSVGVVWNRRAG